LNEAPNPIVAARLARRRPTLANRALDAWEVGLDHVFRRLPMDLGPFLARHTTLAQLRATRPWVLEGARRNLARLRPELPEAEREAMAQRFLAHLAALVGETAAIERQFPAGRVEMVGHEAGVAAHKSGPLVGLSLHTGNWELLGAALRELGVPLSSFYEEAESPGATRVLKALRTRMGVRLLEPTIAGVRQGLRELKEGRVVAVFCDEGREGRIMAPFFGRPPHTEGNLAVAARLARATDAVIVVNHVLRLPGGRFRVVFHPPRRLPPGRRDLLADVVELNGWIEPIIRENLDQWFFLDDALD
jgi:KDO2-lipid IV(A) lauroyltransferase